MVTWVGLGVASAGGTGALARAQASSRASAWTFVYTVTASANGRRAESADLILDVAVWHGVARIGVRSGGLRRLAGDSGTILVRSSDSSVVVVNAARREAIVARGGEVASLVGFGGTGGVQLTVSDVASSVSRRGRGPTAFTFATQRVDATQRYTLQITAGSVVRRLRTDQQLTLVLSRDLERLDPGFRSFVTHFLRALDTPPEVREQLRRSARPLPDGFPVQSVILASTVTGSDTLRTERRAVLSGFKAVAVDTGTFAVPAGFRVTEMSRLLKTRPRS